MRALVYLSKLQVRLFGISDDLSSGGWKTDWFFQSKQKLFLCTKYEQRNSWNFHWRNCMRAGIKVLEFVRMKQLVKVNLHIRILDVQGGWFIRSEWEKWKPKYRFNGWIRFTSFQSIGDRNIEYRYRVNIFISRRKISWTLVYSLADQFHSATNESSFQFINSTVSFYLIRWSFWTFTLDINRNDQMSYLLYR